MRIFKRSLLALTLLTCTSGIASAGAGAMDLVPGDVMYSPETGETIVSFDVMSSGDHGEDQFFDLVLSKDGGPVKVSRFRIVATLGSLCGGGMSGCDGYCLPTTIYFGDIQYTAPTHCLPSGWTCYCRGPRILASMGQLGDMSGQTLTLTIDAASEITEDKESNNSVTLTLP